MDKNILLINPSLNPTSQSKVINQMITTFLPTSIGYLTAFLSGVGIDSVRIVDEQVDFIKEAHLQDLISSLQPPRIIGISALTMNSKRAYELADKTRRIDPEAHIVLGNIHPTVLPEEALGHAGVDVVVRGEGEKTFTELVRAISHQRDYTRISGISFRRNGDIVHNPDQPLIINLDEIPPFPYHLIENVDRYSTFGTILTSRGCPYNCKFCSSRNVSGRRYRYFSTDRILSEVKLLSNKYHQRKIWLVDDNIAIDKKRFNELLDGIIKDGLHEKVEFYTSMRADDAKDETLEKAKAAGFKMISFGLETTSEPLMKVIDKQETVEQQLDAIRRTDEKGIVASATLIFGLPTETRKDRRDAIKTVRSLPLSSVRFNTLVPYPGTPFYRELNPRGKLTIKKDWENFGVQYMWESDDIPYVPDDNSRYELLFDTMYANLSFYLSPSGIKRMIKSSYAGGNVVSFKGRWYLSLKTHWKLFRLLLHLGRRFIYVAFKVGLERLARRIKSTRGRERGAKLI